jgi:hypothetical protein
MIEETLTVLIITGILALLTHCVKNVKTSQCWTKESCINCAMNKEVIIDGITSQPPTPTPTPTNETII